jgi:hypothetical protein
MIKTAPNHPVAILNVKLNDYDETHFELSKPSVRYQHTETCLACACVVGTTEQFVL